jgi:hypothetical protein
VLVGGDDGVDDAVAQVDQGRRVVGRVDQELLACLGQVSR